MLFEMKDKNGKVLRYAEIPAVLLNTDNQEILAYGDSDALIYSKIEAEKSAINKNAIEILKLPLNESLVTGAMFDPEYAMDLYWLSNNRNKKTKTEKLNQLASSGNNIGQFVSVRYTDIEKPEFVHIKDNEQKIKYTKYAILKLLDSAKSKLVNVRSYGNGKTRGTRFILGLDDINEIMDIIEVNASEKLHSIINENINPCDGGVSGVVFGDTIEFAPNDTPRCVDKPGVCSLPRELGIKLLEKVYGFDIELEYHNDKRIEFTINPNKEGIKDEHTLIWEIEEMQASHKARISLNNKFSEFIGNKTYGLLIADLLHLNVPKTTVISRNIKPFEFGFNTTTDEVWTRTAPATKKAGLYTTVKGYIDPFKLLQNEDPTGREIPSVLIQSSADMKYAGACFVRTKKDLDIIEGTSQSGDDFMLGLAKTEDLPNYLLDSLEDLNDKIRKSIELLGEISYEWVYDGLKVWIVQLNKLKSASKNKDTIVDGNVAKFEEFDTDLGLEELRKLILLLDKETIGIKLKGNVGITSHFGDLLRNNQVVSYIERI